MADKRTGFSHLSNKMRSKWEQGVRLNKERLSFARANFKTWEANDGWSLNPQYMCELQEEIKRQEQYLRHRYGETLE